MRVKKRRQVRRAVRFYKACVGFREPFRVLCDGNFLHYVLRERLGELTDLLPALLGGATRIFVTRCVTAELKSLGNDFSETVLAARKLALAQCNHESPKSAAECLEDMVGSENSEHYFVATQDVELRKKFRKVHGGALIFAKMKHLVIEPPSEKQQELARRNESNQSHLKPREVKIVEEREEKKGSLKADSERNDDDEDRPRVASSSRRPKALGIQDKPQFKRKKAKGPNPLSCKKKDSETKNLKRADGEVTVAGRVDSQGEPNKRSRKRVRHRRNSKQNPVQEKMEG